MPCSLGGAFLEKDGKIMKTRLAEIIKKLERPNFPFKPEKDFYKEIGISKKRFWQIYKDEADNLQVSELQRLADYYKVDLKDLLIL